VRPARDAQRSRVYAWEDRVVGHGDRTAIPFAAAQGMVDAIWADLDLRFPPKAEALPRQSRRLQADASRLRIRLPETFASWLLLHELAHALTSSHDGVSDGHGPAFMGIYIRLLVRYARLPEADLLQSAEAAGIRVTRDATPSFVDCVANGPQLQSAARENRHD
jgi:hypothetical protein